MVKLAIVMRESLSVRVIIHYPLGSPQSEVKGQVNITSAER